MPVANHCYLRRKYKDHKNNKGRHVFKRWPCDAPTVRKVNGITIIYFMADEHTWKEPAVFSVYDMLLLYIAQVRTGVFIS